MNAKDVIEYYRTRFQIEFCFRDAKISINLITCANFAHTTIYIARVHNKKSFVKGSE